MKVWILIRCYDDYECSTSIILGVYDDHAKARNMMHKMAETDKELQDDYYELVVDEDGEDELEFEGHSATITFFVEEHEVE